ncbi:transglycosylase SLT domain-containing protein [Streptomyces sp. NPDC059785]|uniref:transglycosylase SLT domain-containing protein n=1 Tax=unclassified Streptomyces TaxID=2593676 RepID=UPI00365B9A06
MLKQNHAPGRSPALTRTHKLSLAGVATLGAAALGFTLVPAHSGSTTTADTSASSASSVAYNQEQIKDVKASLTDQLAGASVKADIAAAKKKAADEAAKKKTDAAAAKKADEAAAAKKATEARTQQASSRSAQRTEVKTVAAKTYTNNLDGWIREALDIMKAKGIPGTYQGLHKNIMRESSGNPKAINDWDINWINGVPSKGLLQVIPPTFKAYHVAGTSNDIYDPVANITAAANYAADKYGSIDNVNSAY